MSTYTTEVRYICDTYANIGNEDNHIDLSVDDKINRALPYIFDESWGTYEVPYKEVLERKILRHFYTREIGFETVSLWKLKLNTKLSEIMPKYNILYQNLDEIKFKLLGNIDLSEHTKTDGSTQSDSNSSSDSISNDSATSVSNATQSSNSSAKGSNSAWQTYNDTPQGGLQGLETNQYLSSATKNNGSSNQDSNTSGNSNTTGTSDSMSKSNSNSTNASKASSTQEYVRTLTGRSGGATYLSDYNRLVTSMINIDIMIIDELNDCFMQLW